MTLHELKHELFKIADQYIQDAEKFQKSSFAFIRHFASPYSNLEQAKKLKILCQETSRDNTAFIEAISNIFTGQIRSANFIPQIAEKILSSNLYSKAKTTAQAIQENINYSNQNNDGGGTMSWDTSDFLAVLKAELPLQSATELRPISS